jgi:hypothetical protein
MRSILQTSQTIAGQIVQVIFKRHLQTRGMCMLHEGHREVQNASPEVELVPPKQLHTYAIRKLTYIITTCFTSGGTMQLNL